jgi:hypothetical protein
MNTKNKSAKFLGAKVINPLEKDKIFGGTGGPNYRQQGLIQQQMLSGFLAAHPCESHQTQQQVMQ